MLTSAQAKVVDDWPVRGAARNLLILQVLQGENPGKPNHAAGASFAEVVEKPNSNFETHKERNSATSRKVKVYTESIPRHIVDGPQFTSKV